MFHLPSGWIQRFSKIMAVHEDTQKPTEGNSQNGYRHQVLKAKQTLSEMYDPWVYCHITTTFNTVVYTSIHWLVDEILLSVSL